MKDLVIIGAGGFGRETKAMVDEINEVNPQWNFIGYIDDGKTDETVEGVIPLGNLDFLCNMNPKPYAVIAIASAHVREAIANKCYAAGVPFATLIHPSVKMRGDLCTIGEGSIICEGFSMAINSHVGKHCIMNMYCGLGHDTYVGDYSGMMSYTITGGDTVIGKYNYFGLRCTVINLINTCDDCTFGAGAVIVKSADVPGTYVGVPAKCIKPLVK